MNRTAPWSNQYQSSPQQPAAAVELRRAEHDDDDGQDQDQLAETESERHGRMIRPTVRRTRAICSDP
jgi:hypothetical protein